jgi:hypothetical protein
MWAVVKKVLTKGAGNFSVNTHGGQVEIRNKFDIRICFGFRPALARLIV